MIPVLPCYLIVADVVLMESGAIFRDISYVRAPSLRAAIITVKKGFFETGADVIVRVVKGRKNEGFFRGCRLSPSFLRFAGIYLYRPAVWSD